MVSPILLQIKKSMDQKSYVTFVAINSMLFHLKAETDLHTEEGPWQISKSGFYLALSDTK